MAKNNPEPERMYLPPIMYNEYSNNFEDLASPTIGLQNTFDLTKFFEVLLAKGKLNGDVLVVNASLVPAQLFINAPEDQQPEDGNAEPV